MAGLVTRELTGDTWEDFAALVEAHGGVWGGCWCMAFHPPRGGPPHSAQENRQDKEARVRAGTAHASLVYDGAACVGWCQYGPCEELPRIKHRRAYDAAALAPPDWRITCFFTARTHRRAGVATAALGAALRAVAARGGGTVESCPEDTAGRRVSGSFLHNATLAVFEDHGFARVRQLGKHHWVVRTVVAPAT